MTLNGVMAVILRYFTEFVYDVVVKKFTFGILSPDELFVSRCREQNIRSLDVSFTIANDCKYSEVYFPKLPSTATSLAFHASYEIIVYT